MRKLIFPLLILCIPAFSQKGYEIKVKINKLKDATLILGHHLGANLYPDDTVKTDAQGVAVFKGNKPLPEGMYFIFLPNKTYFDFLVTENQNFTIENDTTDLFRNIKFINSKENEIFYNYQFFLSKKREEMKALVEEKKKVKSEAEEKTIADKMKSIDNEVKKYRDNLIKQSPNSFVAKFIKATTDIEVPDPPKDAKGNITDSLFQYRYYRLHYFDNMDISDVRLLRTPIYEEKIMNYLTKVIPQIPDTIMREVDMLIARSRTSPELFRYMLVTLFNYYGKSQIMGFDDIALYIADKYYLKEATWSDSTYLKKLRKQVEERKPTMMGKIAPEIELLDVPAEHFLMAMNDTSEKKNVYVGRPFRLSNYTKDFTIIYFWDIDCGHCKKETPIMYEVYQRLKNKNVQVIAISLVFSIENKVKWVDYINEHRLYDWVNAFYPFSIKFKELYNVVSTPSIFILDKNRRIIAKRIGPEQCEEIINFELKKQQNK
ncbi:MAG: thioredoxin-like domain-containing protein [Bacteroidales bacterium]|nr:thioredoxin-like domain-containing protein [Bacteroidales bacterium]